MGGGLIPPPTSPPPVSLLSPVSVKCLNQSDQSDICQLDSNTSVEYSCTDNIVSEDQRNLSMSLSDICQLDGNESFSESLPGDQFTIPVLVSENRSEQNVQEPRVPVRRTIRRNNLILQSMVLPTVMNINPRSIYNKYDEFPLLLDQYSADLICMSESWSKDE